VHGQLSASDLDVGEKVTIHGQATLNDVNFKDDLTVHGQLALDNGVIAGETSIHGQAHISKCRMNNLVVYARKITLTTSTVKNIYVKETNHKTTITLIDSKVEGDIVFDSGNGKVILEDGAAVGGKIIGGDETLQQQHQ
jgi:hypothetical protein